MPRPEKFSLTSWMRKVATMSSSFGSRFASQSLIPQLLYPLMLHTTPHTSFLYSLSQILYHICNISRSINYSMEMEYDERTSDNTHLIALGCPMYERDLKVCQLHAAAVKAAQNSLENPLFTGNSGTPGDTTLVPITTAYHLDTPCEVNMSLSSHSSSLSPSLSSSPISISTSSPSSSNQNVSIKPTESGNFMSKFSLNKHATFAVAIAT